MTFGAAPAAGLGWAAQPAVHEVNTLIWLGEVSRRVGADVTLGSVPAREWCLH